jgi:hypothetical protein
MYLRRRPAAKAVLSPEASTLRTRGGQAFSRPKLVEHRSVGGQDLRVKRMNETIHVARGSASLPFTSPARDKSTLAQSLHPPQD